MAQTQQKNKRGPGRPQTEIPEELCAWLEKTYAGNALCEMEVERESEGTNRLIRFARLYCKRQQKKLSYEIIERDNQSVLRMRMRDVRGYSRRTNSAGESS